MKEIRLFLTGLLLMVASAAFAQNIKVSGTVTDASTGEPVIGASVLLQGEASVYAMTDVDGKYVINVPSNGTLVVSFLGYTTATVAVNGRTVVDIPLSVDVESLEETVVVGYGTTTKKSFTGSVTSVKSEKIESQVAANVTTALAGSAAGVQVIASSGDPTGSSPTIRIRGVGTMSASSSPLYVLDGVPYSGSVSDINPNDVESMTVLKDAAASAIYGSRAANGVVLITTKKGSSGNLPNVKFDAKWGSNSRLVPQYDVIDDPAQYYETYFKLLYNKYNYAGKSAEESYKMACNALLDENNGGLGYLVYTIPEGQNLIGTNFKLNPNATLGYSDGEYYYTPDNWYDEVYHNSFRQEYNLSVSGNKDKLSYYTSFGYLDDGGMVNKSRYQRYTGRINADYQAKKWMKISTNMSYSHSDSQSPSYDTDFGSSANIFYITNTICPIYPLYVRDASGNIMVENGRIQYDSNQTNFKRSAFVGNAVRDNEVNDSKSYADVLNGQLGLVFTPVKGLSIEGNLGVHNDNTRSNSLYSKYGNSSAVEGATSVSHYRRFDVTLNGLAKYKTDFNGSKSHLDVMAGYERYQTKTQSLSGYNDHLFDPFIGELGNAHGKSSISTSSNTQNILTQSLFARVDYDWAGRYFISGTFRRDGSSRFADGHQWGNFFGAGAAWLISAEPWMANAEWVDLLKLRASWGQNGNDQIGTYPYANQYTFSYNEGTGQFSQTLSYKGNPDLTWETTTGFDFGVDFEFFGGYLNGTIGYYNRLTTDLLYSKQVPASSGNPTGSFPVNVGSIRNKGYELSFDGKIFDKKNFYWNWNVNLSHNKNTIESLDESIAENGVKSSYYIWRIGGAYHEAYMLESAGLSEVGEALYWKDVKDDDGNITGRETTNDPTKATQYDLGDINAKVFGGFGTTLSFFGVDVSAQFSYQLGGKYYDGSYQAFMHTQSNPGQAMHKDLLNAWTPENTNTDIPRLDGNVLLSQTACDRFLVSSDYLSLNNAQIGYTFPKKWMNKAKIGSIRLYVAGQNLFLLTKRKGIDPRSNTGLGSYTSGSGLNTGGYSALRNVTGGITLTF